MIWVLLGGAAVGLGILQRIHAHRQWWEGPNLRAQLQQWDRNSPPIKPAKLPKIQPLRGVKVTRWALLRGGR